MEREVDVRERVPGPFDRVCAVLSEHDGEVLGAAAGEVGRRRGAELSVTKAGTKVGRRVVVDVGPLRREEEAARQTLRWRAAEQPELFPSMDAELELRPVGEWATELRLVGRYRPPLGFLGALGDAVVGGPLAQASVRTFLGEVARRLTDEVVRRSRSASWGTAAPPYGPSLRDR